MNQKSLTELTKQCGFTLSTAESQRVVTELSAMLTFVDQIHTFPTDDVDPLEHLMVSESTQVQEEPYSDPVHDLYLEESIEFIEHFYLVPRVIDP